MKILVNFQLKIIPWINPSSLLKDILKVMINLIPNVNKNLVIAFKKWKREDNSKKRINLKAYGNSWKGLYFVEVETILINCNTMRSQQMLKKVV
jgi:hypothetical protein